MVMVLVSFGSRMMGTDRGRVWWQKRKGFSFISYRQPREKKARNVCRGEVGLVAVFVIMWLLSQLALYMSCACCTLARPGLQ